MKTKILFFFLVLLIAACGKTEEQYMENHPLHHLNEKEIKKNLENRPEPQKPEYTFTETDDVDSLMSELVDKTRDIWQKPEKVMEMLGRYEDLVIADLGCGTGYFTFRLAEKASKVIAIDIDQEYLSYIDSVKMKLPESFSDKIETRLVPPDDAKINDAEIDGVIVVNTYSFIGNRIEYFTKLRKGLKSGGKLLVVDYKKKKIPEGMAPPEEVRVGLGEIIDELEEAGYRISDTDDSTLDYQYILLAINP